MLAGDISLFKHGFDLSEGDIAEIENSRRNLEKVIANPLLML